MVISHADYSLLADYFGQEVVLPNRDPLYVGPISLEDFDTYVLHYGEMLSSPGILPFSATPTATLDGNVEWVFTFSEVSGGLAGHLNIETDGPTILSATAGPSFMDDGAAPVGVPGIDAGGGISQGISWSGNTAFAALGTTLVDTSSGPPYVDATLDFLTLVTAGNQPTTISFSGEYGYQGIDYILDNSASYVPEPSTLLMLFWLASIGCGWRVRRRLS